MSRLIYEEEEAIQGGTTNGADALPVSMLAEKYSLTVLQGFAYSENILAGRASAPFVVPPCTLDGALD